MNGKGSARRPTQVSQKQLAENWERTFRHGISYATRTVDGKTYYLETTGGIEGDEPLSEPFGAYITATAHKAKRTTRR